MTKCIYVYTKSYSLKNKYCPQSPTHGSITRFAIMLRWKVSVAFLSLFLVCLAVFRSSCLDPVFDLKHLLEHYTSYCFVNNSMTL